jgi:XTP/dITP diphosphohydrolase
VARIVLLVTSPRLPAGLLTAEAWDLVRAHPVHTATTGPQVDALRHAGVAVTTGAPDPDTLIAAADAHGTVVWLAAPAGDEQFARTLGLRLAREPGRAELELMYGSWDPPGARLLDAVEVMARLVAPDGDPWKRSQTHLSLARYLLEESYEAYDAMLADDPDALREELGDVLLQVVLHAALATGWTIDDVAGGLVDKLVRRNPHVFADAEATSLADITALWDRAKAAEKTRDSVLDGIVPAQPALALATKVLDRLAKADFPAPPLDGTGLGADLFRLVAQAHQEGAAADAEAALRVEVRRYMERTRAAEGTG